VLSDSELGRYSRQLLVDGFGGAAQERLKDATAIIIGAGALGCPAAAYLAAAGVGRIGIVDSDAVELSNLQRQPVHYTPDIGMNKAENAALKLGMLNPEVVLEPYPVRLDAANAGAIVEGADVVVDCSDSFETRYEVNDACCSGGIDLVEGGVAGFAGVVMAIRPGVSACYRCMFPRIPVDALDCREGGVLGPVAGIVGAAQALEALKLLSAVGAPLLDAIQHLDGATLDWTRVATSRLDDCEACGGVRHNPR
jgi:molybdopterin/thiamine biosynthesis adenylyltransferase